MVGTFALQLRTPETRTVRESASASALNYSPGAAQTSDSTARVSASPDARSVASKGALFTYAQPANAAALTAALPAPTREMHYVRTNTALAEGKSSPFWQPPGEGRVVLPLPDGRNLTVVIDDSKMLGVDRFTSVGRVEGRAESRAVFAYNEGYLHATVEDAVLGSFVVRTATEEFSQFYQVDPAMVAPCGGERFPDLSADTSESALVTTPPTGAAAPNNPQRPEVHVMMVYTPAVLTSMSGTARTSALQSAFDQAIARVNAALDASLVTARLKLVKIWETQYDETASAGNAVQNDALTALQATSDGKMDDIHAVRTQVGADLVCLALNRADTASSGLGYILQDAYDSTEARWAFSVVQYGNIAGTRVVPHELGHNLGCAHDRGNTTNGGAFSYSYGYRFQGANGQWYRDIMGYPYANSSSDPAVRGPFATDLLYYSNPDVIAPAPVNARVGIAVGQPGEANAALTIEQTAFAVANYRLQTQTVANAGSLINVSTRAFVGTGDQVLIGGFVVQGTEAKRMLIRAAGPSLRTFGVTDVLENPALSIVPLGGTQLAANDNWNDDAPDGAAVAAQVGAFTFQPGSRDAAVVRTLAPGLYTAIVEGVGNTTGSALVEAYEVSQGANRIVNLSTRGYVDGNGKEMFGGLVISGPPGSTKRVLIRVLGPTLGRAPFNMTGVLNDPAMTLYSANSSVLIENDDWASQSTARDDFRPIVQSYDEQQISATGFAPSNRREPCILVDLPPGAYTVIVKPFENAQGGVAIIEAYEINP